MQHRIKILQSHNPHNLSLKHLLSGWPKKTEKWIIHFEFSLVRVSILGNFPKMTFPKNKLYESCSL